jgi:hypothetical protein
MLPKAPRRLRKAYKKYNPRAVVLGRNKTPRRPLKAL